MSTPVAVGQPAAEILRAARAVGASLLVIGAGGRTRLGSRLFGESGTLFRDAACPVPAVPVSDTVEQRVERERRMAT